MLISTRLHPLLLGLLGAVLTSSCGGADEPLDTAALGEEGDGAESASAALAALSGAPFAACPEPRPFEPGTFSLPEQHEYRVAFTPDGKTAFFGRSDEFFPESRQATLYMSERVDGAWSTPVVAPFSGVYPDLDPFVSSDGQRLYFSSIRPVDGVPRTDVDLWVVERDAAGWSEPKNLGPRVNSASDELFPSVSDDGMLYFGSDRPGGAGAFDIWRVPLLQGDAALPENIGGPINTEGLEFNPWISPEGRVLLLTALNRPGGYGAGDLYVSVDLGWGFSEPLNLGPCVNTSADEYHAAPRLDTGQLFFARLHFDPVWIPGDLYVLDLRRLGAGALE